MESSNTVSPATTLPSLWSKTAQINLYWITKPNVYFDINANSIGQSRYVILMVIQYFWKIFTLFGSMWAVFVRRISDSTMSCGCSTAPWLHSQICMSFFSLHLLYCLFLSRLSPGSGDRPSQIWSTALDLYSSVAYSSRAFETRTADDSSAATHHRYQTENCHRCFLSECAPASSDSLTSSTCGQVHLSSISFLRAAQSPLLFLLGRFEFSWFWWTSWC